MASLVAIVVAHDSADVLPACLAALAGQHVPAIVVDNASRDASVAVAEAAGARVIRNARNEGYGRANNRGVRAAEAAEHVLIVNPDVVPAPGRRAMPSWTRPGPGRMPASWRRGSSSPTGASSSRRARCSRPISPIPAAGSRCRRGMPARRSSPGPA